MSIDIEKLARAAGLRCAKNIEFRMGRGQELTVPEREEYEQTMKFAALVLEQAAKKCESRIDKAKESELYYKAVSLDGKDGELSALRFHRLVSAVNDAHLADAVTIRAMKPKDAA